MSGADDRLAGDDRELFARSIERATSTSTGAPLDEALADLGWHDALGVDRRTAVTLLFEAQGRANATSSALDAVLATAAGVDPAGLAVVLPPLGSTAPSPDGRGLALGSLDRATTALVNGTYGLRLVDVADLTVRPVAGIDPGLGLRAVEVDVVPRWLAGAAPGWAGGLPVGQLALASELVGAARAMLELARTHALERVQFDRPIGQFQAVRHKLADTLVGIEAAAGAIDAAWEQGTPTAAMAAKALAGRSARLAAKHCQQVLAGIGFTLEHGFHHHLRRALVLDRLLGDTKVLTKSLGDQLLADRAVPPMLAL